MAKGNARGALEKARQVTVAEEHLRREIAELLHGPVQTKLLMAWFRLGQCLDLLDTDPAGARSLLEEVRAEIDRVREDEVRRASHLLYPSILRVGLAPALRSLAASFEPSFAVAVTADSAVTAADDPVHNRIPETHRLTAYRVVEEALANVSRHAGAAKAEVSLAIEGDCLLVSVEDDGRGFDTGAGKIGLGLSSVAGRVAQVDGSWEIRSALGKGTRLSARIPLAVEDSLGARPSRPPRGGQDVAGRVDMPSGMSTRSAARPPREAGPD